MKHHYSTPEALAEHLLGRPFAELDEDEQHVLRHVVSRHVELQDDERLAAHASFGDRLADRVAAVGGSWGFILGFAVVLVLWALLNNPHLAAMLGITAWDAYPFIFLNLMLSMLAAIQAPVIMMSQNRQSIKDRIYNRHDYEVNLRTTIEILKLRQRIDRLTQDVAAMRQAGKTPD